MDRKIKEYYDLLQEDREYLRKYVLKESVDDEWGNCIKQFMEEQFIWRKITDYSELENVIASQKAFELLRIEDYYSDELCELLEKHLEVDFRNLSEEEFEKILSEENLQELLEKEETPEQLKECIRLERKCHKICKNLYDYLQEYKKDVECNDNNNNRTFSDKEIKLTFGEIKKCAIFVHYSINDEKRIQEKKDKLEKFCEEELKTDNYEIFIEIDSFLGDRNVFNSMLKRFETGEFSHLVVVDIGQIYKLSYDMNKTFELTDKIRDMNVTIISVDEERIIESKDRLIKIQENSQELTEVDISSIIKLYEIRNIKI